MVKKDSTDYISKKDVIIEGEVAKLTKTNNHIRVTRNRKVLYNGDANGYHKYIRDLRK